MKKRSLQKGCVGVCLLAAFVLWTIAVRQIDVQPIGPNDSQVGLATLNGWFHRFTGVHLSLYVLTDWLGLVPFFAAFGFAVFGLVQWIKRKKLWKVDYSILVLGGFYLLVMGAYLFFEVCVVNYRPILIDGFLEASYPSSTTMLVTCVMPTAIMQLRPRIKTASFRRAVTVAIAAFVAFMVIGRLISGVHWLSDIIGGLLISGGLVMTYSCVADMELKK